MQFNESAGGLLLPTEGHVTVDLLDARTRRVIQREESRNFLSLQSLEVAKWWQRMMWGFYNPNFTADAAGNKPHEMPWFPAQHIAYWNDASAEDPATELRVAKDIVGWASRHPVGSPSGKRGVVNVTESEVTDAAAKWVFDWATSQGNGTFQSVGWTRIQESSGFPIARFPEDDTVAFTPAASSGAAFGAPLWWDSSANLWYGVRYAGSGVFQIYSAPASGGATTDVLAVPTSFVNTNWLMGLAKIGTDFILVASVANQFKLARITAAGVVSWNANPSGLTSFPHDVTVDGSGDIWTCDGAGVVRRHNNSTGAITATVNPTLAPSALYGIAYDASDGNFWALGTVSGTAYQVWKMDNSGNTVGPLYSISAGNVAPVSSAPYVGNYYVPGSGSRDPYAFAWGSNSSSIATGNFMGPGVSRFAGTAVGLVNPYAPLTMKDGLPWIAGKVSSQAVDRAFPIRGRTLGTRSKLTSAVTKTSSQVLKVTYQFNFS